MHNNTSIPIWRVLLLHWAGKLFGIKFHLHGCPYGSGSSRYDFEPGPLPPLAS